MERKPITFEEWKAEAIRRFGHVAGDWQFVCPSCGNVQTMRQFRELGVGDDNLAYYNCIGRYDGKNFETTMGTKPGPCNYTGGGLFGLNPVAVIHPETGDILHVFAFAGEPGKENEHSTPK